LKRSAILGTGYYVPEKVVTNADMEKIVETTDEWIRTRTGIQERRFAAPDEYTSDMGFRAAENAIRNAGINKEDIGLIITATVTGDYNWPSTAGIIQKKLGLPGIPAFDVSAACSGFIYGLSISDAMIKSGKFKKILLIGVEKLSVITDMTDRNTCVLLGDGAGAVVLGESESDGIMSVVIHADGSKTDILYQPAGGSVNPATHETVDKRMHYLKMDGKEVFKLAVEKMPSVLEESMAEAGLKAEDIDFVIFHQANIRIIEYIAKKFNWPVGKNIINIQKYGNTSAATIPIALAEAMEQKKIKKGDIVAFSTFGAGMTWGGAVVKI
jgi:3-oxoacyl-[acyl-carrier-protein] synthase-3